MISTGGAQKSTSRYVHMRSSTTSVPESNADSSSRAATGRLVLTKAWRLVNVSDHTSIENNSYAISITYIYLFIMSHGMLPWIFTNRPEPSQVVPSLPAPKKPS